MEMLFIEDDENKRRQITNHLSTNHGDINVETAASLIPALRAIKTKPFDVILLDMTLPNYDLGDEVTGGGMHAFGGEEVLRQIDRREISTSVIVITQFETFGEHPDTKNFSELDEDLRSKFPGVYVGAVYYHASIDDWMNKLDAMLKQVKN